MGTEYAIADHQNKRFFDMGKDLFLFDLLEICDNKPTSLDKIKTIFTETCEDYGNDSLSYEYAVNLAISVYEFCVEAKWDISVVNDVDDSWLELWRDKGYVETHNRYTQEKPRGTWAERMI